MRISDWSSDVCSSDLAFLAAAARPLVRSQSIDASMSPWFSASAFLQSIMPAPVRSRSSLTRAAVISAMGISFQKGRARNRPAVRRAHGETISQNDDWDGRSEEHTSEIQSLMRNSYADFLMKQNKHHQ